MARGEPRVAPRLVGRSVLLLVLVVAFVALAIDARSQSGGILIDGPLARWLGTRGGAWGHRAARGASIVGSPPFVIAVSALAAVWLVWRRRWITGLAVLAAAGIAGVASTVGKDVIGKGDPPDPSLGSEFGRGYPSGHVAAATALLLVVLTLVVLPVVRSRRQRWALVAVAVAVIAAIAASRIALELHYFSDTVGGALLGAGVAITVVTAAQWAYAQPWGERGSPRRSEEPSPAGAQASAGWASTRSSHDSRQ